MAYRELDHWEQIPVKSLIHDIAIFIYQMDLKCRLQNGSHFVSTSIGLTHGPFSCQ